MPMKLLSYNVDGLRPISTTTEQSRFEESNMQIVRDILQTNADIVALQEVTQQTLPFFTHLLSENYVLPHADTINVPFYFTVTFVKKGIEILSNRRLQFQSNKAMSSMDRDMLATSFKLKDTIYHYVNLHLESMADSAATRKAQLHEVLQYVSQQPDEHFCLLAGDLNIREKEFKAVMSSYPSFYDVYISSHGNNAGIMDFTWCRRMPYSVHPKRNRYDRAIYRQHRAMNALRAVQDISSSNGASGSGYHLIGTTAITLEGNTSWGYDTPSDHFGMVCTFGNVLEDNNSSAIIASSAPTQFNYNSPPPKKY